MKKIAKKILGKTGYTLNKAQSQREVALDKVYQQFKEYTMIHPEVYKENLRLALQLPASIPGDVVECGVWRGGMSAGIATLLGNSRKYYLFDSFEGLPPAKEIDGESAKAWQENKEAPDYFENCKAEIEFAEKAMQITGCHYTTVKGWFSDSLPNYPFEREIALLRLDGDWYESTMDCLVNLFPKVAEGGYVVIDDYFSWVGCARAVHDYLSAQQSSSRIYTSNQGVCYIIKQKSE